MEIEDQLQGLTLREWYNNWTPEQLKEHILSLLPEYLDYGGELGLVRLGADENWNTAEVLSDGNDVYFRFSIKLGISDPFIQYYTINENGELHDFQGCPAVYSHTITENDLYHVIIQFRCHMRNNKTHRVHGKPALVKKIINISKHNMDKNMAFIWRSWAVNGVFLKSKEEEGYYDITRFLTRCVRSLL